MTMGKRYDLGEGYYITYDTKANKYWIGNHDVNITLYHESSAQPIKQITDDQGRFLEYPGTVDGDWRKKLSAGFDRQIDFSFWMSGFKNGFSRFSWKVQPDGRYWEDREFLSEEEIVLHSYMNRKGEFVTPFASFEPEKYMESQDAFEHRTNGFIWTSLPEGYELWVNEGAKKKVNSKNGEYKPFFGNTLVFPLEGKILGFLEDIQGKLEVIRKDPAVCVQGQYLADKLEKDTYHITLHDLISGEDEAETAIREKRVQEEALRTIRKLRELNFPMIKMKTVCLYVMNGTSVVLGFQAINEEDHEKLMMLYELFQTIVELPYPMTPHVTLSYFRYQKRHDKQKVQGLRDIIREVNEQIARKGEELIIELDVGKLVYQHFSSMNCYETIE